MKRRQFFALFAGAAALCVLPVKAAWQGITIRYGVWRYGKFWQAEIDANGASLAEVYDAMTEDRVVIFDADTMEVLADFEPESTSQTLQIVRML